MKQRLKPFQFFAPIQRVDEEERIVEGYVFVNEVVEGEGGIRLRREAMEAATPDYLRWGAVRVMHQPIAAGTARAPGCGVEWDAKGAYLRVKIVDDQEWKKVREGVYTGFSVGVIPKLMRGKAIEQCVWAESSLVDRPKDPGAVITAFRMEGVDLEAEVEVEVLEGCEGGEVWGCGGVEERPTGGFGVERGEWRGEGEGFDGTGAGWREAEGPRGWGAEGQESRGAGEPRGRGVEGSSPSSSSSLGASEGSYLEARTPIERLRRLAAERERLTERVTGLEAELEAAEAALAAERRRRSAAEAQVGLGRRGEASGGRAPVRYAQALPREFLVNRGEPGVAVELAAKLAEYGELREQAQREREEGARQGLVARMLTLKGELRELGCTLP